MYSFRIDDMYNIALVKNDVEIQISKTIINFHIKVIEKLNGITLSEKNYYNVIHMSNMEYGPKYVNYDFVFIDGTIDDMDEDEIYMVFANKNDYARFKLICV